MLLTLAYLYTLSVVNAANLRSPILSTAVANGSSQPLSKASNHSVVDLPASLFSVHSSKQSPAATVPKLFVAVFTTRSTPVDKRNSIRQLWLEVDGGQGNICARFIFCNAPADAFEQSLQSEQATNGDVLFLPCQEGYAQGLLTRKVIATMRAYRQASTTGDDCLNRPLFMKVDDDTFVAGNRFRQGLAMAHSMYGENMYGGVDLPSQPPNRDPASHWYEPWNVFSQQNYPPAMYGGPGYLLGRAMIERIIDEGIAETYVLWNEDRAVGVWVNALQQRGAFVNWVRIPGTNGFHWDKPVKSGPWGQYPYVLAHHLSKTCIMCLTSVDRTNDLSISTDPCFMLDPLPG